MFRVKSSVSNSCRASLIEDALALVDVMIVGSGAGLPKVRMPERQADLLKLKSTKPAHWRLLQPVGDAWGRT